MVSTYIKVFGTLYKFPDFGTFQVIQLIFVCGTKISDETTIMTRNNYSTFACRRVHGHVLGSYSFLFGRSTKLSGKIIFSNTSHIYC